jgi:ribonuclease HI
MSHVFDAEAIGAWKGLEHVIKDPATRTQRIWMCIDSTSVIWWIRGIASDTSQWAFHNCQDAMQTHDVHIKWSPGHMGIEGNKEADRLADKGANMIQFHDDIRDEPTISGIRSIARSLKHEAAYN